MTVHHIAPDCPPEVEHAIRKQAAERGEQVMPARPFPWNRAAVAALERTPAGPQHVLPGAGRDQASALRRRAAAPLKPGVPQAACDVGLFGDTHRQADLLDLAGKP